MRVANYNIKSAELSSLDDIADVLASMEADVIALEEVDRDTNRSGRVDQSAVLAEKLGMSRIFAAAMERDGGQYGVALLTKLPVIDAAPIQLPHANGLEPRVAIDAMLCAGGRHLRVLTAHADVFPWSAAVHIGELAREADASFGEGVIVLGDLNLTPKDEAFRPFTDLGLLDLLGIHAEGPTFGGDRRLDYIWVDGALEVEDAEILDTDASDHLPIRADLVLKG